MSSSAGSESITNLEKLRFNQGSIPLPQLRSIIRNVMHKHAGIFRNEASLRQGVQMMEEAYKAFNDIDLGDTSIIW